MPLPGAGAYQNASSGDRDLLHPTERGFYPSRRRASIKRRQAPGFAVGASDTQYVVGKTPIQEQVSLRLNAFVSIARPSRIARSPPVKHFFRERADRRKPRRTGRGVVSKDCPRRRTGRGLSQRARKQRPKTVSDTVRSDPKVVEDRTRAAKPALTSRGWASDHCRSASHALLLLGKGPTR